MVRRISVLGRPGPLRQPCDKRTGRGQTRQIHPPRGILHVSRPVEGPELNYLFSVDVQWRQHNQDFQNFIQVNQTRQCTQRRCHGPDLRIGQTRPRRHDRVKRTICDSVSTQPSVTDRTVLLCPGSNCIDNASVAGSVQQHVRHCHRRLDCGQHPGYSLHDHLVERDVPQHSHAFVPNHESGDQCGLVCTHHALLDWITGFKGGEGRTNLNAHGTCHLPRRNVNLSGHLSDQSRVRVYLASIFHTLDDCRAHRVRILDMGAASNADCVRTRKWLECRTSERKLSGWKCQSKSNHICSC